MSGVRSVDRFGDISYSRPPGKLILDSEAHIINAEYKGCLLALYLRGTPKARPYCPYSGYSSATGDDIFSRVERAAAGGLGVAQHELFRYYAGFGPVHLARGSLPLISRDDLDEVKQLERKALTWLEKAASPCACSGIPGRCGCDKAPITLYFEGERHKDNTFTWTRGAHQHHQTDKMLNIYSCAGYNYPLDPRRDVSARSLAQYELGAVHQRGLFDVPADQVKAQFFFKKSAKNGHAGAQYQVGKTMLLQGLRDEAVTYLKLSAEGGCADAMYELYILLDEETANMDVMHHAALNENLSEAFNEDPSRGGGDQAQRHCVWQRNLQADCICGAPIPVGRGCYRDGSLFRPSHDFEAAVMALPRYQLGSRFFTACSMCVLAARLGHSGAMNAFGNAQNSGKWEKLDRPSDINVWKLRAADAGNPDALFDLANNFENGTYYSATLGYPVSFLLECYEKATEGGSQAARQRLAQVFRLGELGQEVDLLRSVALEQPLERMQNSFAGFPIYGVHYGYIRQDINEENRSVIINYPTLRFASLGLKKIELNNCLLYKAPVVKSPELLAADDEAYENELEATRVRVNQDAAHLEYMRREGVIQMKELSHRCREYRGQTETYTVCAERLGRFPFKSIPFRSARLPAQIWNRKLSCGLYHKEIITVRAPESFQLEHFKSYVFSTGKGLPFIPWYEKVDGSGTFNIDGLQMIGDVQVAQEAEGSKNEQLVCYESRVVDSDDDAVYEEGDRYYSDHGSD